MIYYAAAAHIEQWEVKGGMFLPHTIWTVHHRIRTEKLFWLCSSALPQNFFFFIIYYQIHNNRALEVYRINVRPFASANDVYLKITMQGVTEEKFAQFQNIFKLGYFIAFLKSKHFEYPEWILSNFCICFPIRTESS